jgi:hypothetical protein
MLFKQTVPPPINGVTQAAPESRAHGYADVMDNAFPSPVQGLGVRKGTTALAIGLGTDATHEAEYAPTDDERYLAILGTSGIRVIDLLTGASRPVTTSGDTAGFFGTGRFSSVAVGEELFVVSRGYSKGQLTGSPSAAQAPDALVTVEQGAPSALYKIVLDGIEVSVRTPDDPPPATKRPAVAVNVDAAVSQPSSGAYFTLSPGLWQKIVEAGYSTSAAYTVARGNGFTGTVGLSASAPVGITGTFTDTSLANGETASTLNITASPTLVAGIYSIFVTASSPGFPSASSEVRLSVTTNGGPPPPERVIEVVITDTPTIAAGSSASVAVTLNRSEGVTSQITLSSVGLSVGSATFTPNPAGTTATMTLSVFSGTAAGSYSFTVHGSTPDGLTDDVTVNFTVPVGTDPAITLSASPSGNTVPPDSSMSTDLTLTRLNSYTGDVTLTVLSTPPGVTAGLLDSLLDSGETTATMSIFVSSSAVPGTYDIPVRAAGTGVDSVTALYTLTIT